MSPPLLPSLSLIMRSAHECVRCAPCRATTPELARAYKSLRANGKLLQLIFVSSDKDEDEYEAYREKMPWPALPFHSMRRALLNAVFRVQARARTPCTIPHPAPIASRSKRVASSRR